ncbi:MAG: hypothetical protein M3258_01100 [Thermoproteota archaeon]|nr:hypothetical protein [Thermoproteota archaeon]
MSIVQSKRNLVAAAALLMAVGALATATLTASPVLAQEEERTTTGSDTTTGGGGGTTGGGGGTTGGATTTGGGGGTTGGVRVQQGTVISERELLPGHAGHQAAVILAPNDGRVYTGTLTFTASRTVQVELLQIQNLNSSQQLILNATSSDVGTLLTSKLDNRTNVVVTYIRPGEPSASVPFAANAVLLHSLSGDPFVATYTVSYTVEQPRTVNSIANATLPAGGDGGGGDGDGGGD